MVPLAVPWDKLLRHYPIGKEHVDRLLVLISDHRANKLLCRLAVLKIASGTEGKTAVQYLYHNIIAGLECY